MYLVLKSQNIKNGKIYFNLPQHRFDEKREFEFRVVHLYVALGHSKYTKSDLSSHLISLQSNLIDRSPFNPHQDLLFLPVSDLSAYTIYTPTHFLRYKLRLQDLNDAEFFLHSENPDIISRVSFVSLQIEIIPYGWVQ